MSSPQASAPLTDRLHRLAATPVGPELVAELAGLDEEAPGWAAGAQVHVAAAWARVATWAEAHVLAAVAAGAQAVAALDSPAEAISYATEVALATGSGERLADQRISLALDLATRLPDMRAAMHQARLTVTHARALARALDSADEDISRRIDQRLVPRAIDREWTPSQLAAAARRALACVDTRTAAERHDRALDTRATVTGGPMADGLGWLSATGDAVTVSDILAAVDRRADQLAALAPGVPIGRLRFAALGDLVLRERFAMSAHLLGTTTPPGEAAGGATNDGCREAAGPRRTRRNREMIVTLGLPTLLGLRDDPPEIAGFGAVPAHLVRLLTTDSTLRRLVFDPVTGETLDIGRRAYVPTAALSAAVRARDRRCVFPGCSRVRRAQIDHRRDWASEGHTSEANLALLCLRHHTLKTAGLWTVTTNPDGSTLTWSGPYGRRIVAPRMRIDRDDGHDRDDRHDGDGHVDSHGDSEPPDTG
jgi:hypothetical protein